MGCKMILLYMITFVIIARLSSAGPSLRAKIRGSNKPALGRRYKITMYLKTTESGDQRARPSHTRLARLWSKLRFHLAVLLSGTLHGVNDTYCQQTNRCLFELQSCDTGIIRIRHVASGLYVAINKAGKVYTTPRSHRSDALFVEEMLPNGFTVFMSERSSRRRKNLMFLGLKRNGAAKRASKTSSTHKSVHFMVMLQHTLPSGNAPKC